MFTLAIGILLALPGLAGGHEISDVSLKGFAPKSRVTSLKFRGKTMRRAEEPAVEALELSLSHGDDITLDLTESEELKLHGICGSHHVGTHDVMVTGCEGEDRSITIGGHGSWEYEAKSATFRRVDEEDVLEDCGSIEPPEEDEEAMAQKAAFAEMIVNGEPMQAQMRGRTFDTEVRYYYDISLLERYDNDHARARAAVRELNAHGEVLMRHDSLGMPVNLIMRVEPVFVDLRTHAGPPGALDGFMRWLSGRGLCDDSTIAFHHLITDHRRGDGVAGVAFIGTVCHSRCFNTGITEIASTVARAATVLAHEMGHNLGAHHTHHSSNAGRGCRGIMSYGVAPDTWSFCAREDWEADYAAFVRSQGQSRADTCFVPSNGAPRPTSPTPVRPNPRPTPTPPPVQRPTNPNGGGSECRIFPGLDVSSGFRHHRNSGAIGIMSDAACNNQCLIATGCTVWVRSPSRNTCWLSTQTGTIRLRSANDRVVGAPCRGTFPAPRPTATPAPRPVATPAPRPTATPALQCTLCTGQNEFFRRNCEARTKSQCRGTNAACCHTKRNSNEPCNHTFQGNPSSCTTGFATRVDPITQCAETVCRAPAPTPPPTFRPFPVPTPRPAPLPTFRPFPVPTPRPAPLPTSRPVPPPTPSTPTSPLACESFGARDCAELTRCQWVRIGGRGVCGAVDITPSKIATPSPPVTTTPIPVTTTPTAVNPRTASPTTPCESLGAKNCATASHCELARIGTQRMCITPCASLGARDCASSSRCEMKRIGGARVCAPSASGVPPAVAPPAPVAPPRVSPPARTAPPAVAQRPCGSYSDKECASSTRCGLSRVGGRKTCVDLAASSTSVAAAPPAVPKRCQKNWSNDGRCAARFGGQVCKSDAPFCSNSGRCQARSFGNVDFDYPQGCDTVVA